MCENGSEGKGREGRKGRGRGVKEGEGKRRDGREWGGEVDGGGGFLFSRLGATQLH